MVGYQHKYNSGWAALRSIYTANGLAGLWRGASGAIARVAVGSAAQLSTYAKVKDVIKAEIGLHDGALLYTMASLFDGISCSRPNADPMLLIAP